MPTRTALLISAAAAATLTLSLTACGPSNHRTTTPTGPTTSAQAPTQSAILATGAPIAPGPTVAGPTVTTTGTGTVNGTPDTLTVSIDVSTTASHVNDALQENNVTSAAVQHALEHDGVAMTDIQTGNLSVQENYDGSNIVSGYVADDTVSATIHQMSNAGTAINDAIAAAGDSGRLNGITLSMSDTNPLMAAARQRAVAAARTQAQQLAAAAGERLGGLVSLTDQPEPQPYIGAVPGFAAANSTGAASGAPVPVQPGSQQLSVQVTAVWSLVSPSSS
jgi:uncharacterized protein YggE